MHTLNRIAVGGVLLAAAIPFYTTFAQVVPTKEELTSRLETVIQDAKDAYRFARGQREMRVQNKGLAKELEKQLVVIAQKRREQRLKVAFLRHELAKVQTHSSGAALELAATSKLLGRESAQLLSFLRFVHLRDVAMNDTGPTDTSMRLLFSHVFGASLGETVDEDLRMMALSNARQELIVSLIATSKDLDTKISKLSTAEQAYTQRLVIAEGELDSQEKDYADMLKKIAIANNEDQVTDEQKTEEAAIAQEVGSQVQGIQDELARINMRYQRKAERDLIRLGILDAQPGEHSEDTQQKAVTYSSSYIWPVHGPVSAGFHDTGYFRHFGFNHNAVDIVTHQGTAVKATADGVVFKARDGGAKGFSYILIGHGGGYTSLYGHMFQMIVTPGEEVHQGDIIGYSGGIPGTWGAGPYTTGAHVHFQMTLNGKLIDPLTVLP
ncbi:MAG: peptidase [Candidatus Peribacteria bacterium]|nr:peptidase [Candidatus Peribacteria bacterium]